jgi:hypothetical protein
MRPLRFSADTQAMGELNMKSKLAALCVLSFGLATVGSAQAPNSSAQPGAQLTKAQVKQLVREAHTPEQYNALARYYSAQQKSFLQQADDEKKEWIRRSQNIVSVAAKYPRPVDSARYLYEYETYEASEAGQLAAKYNRLATPDPSAKDN